MLKKSFSSDSIYNKKELWSSSSKYLQEQNHRLTFLNETLQISNQKMKKQLQEIIHNAQELRKNLLQSEINQKDALKTMEDKFRVYRHKYLQIKSQFRLNTKSKKKKKSVKTDCLSMKRQEKQTTSKDVFPDDQLRKDLCYGIIDLESFGSRQISNKIASEKRLYKSDNEEKEDDIIDKTSYLKKSKSSLNLKRKSDDFNFYQNYSSLSGKNQFKPDSVSIEILKRMLELFDNYKTKDLTKSRFTANQFRRNFNSNAILGRSSNKFESANELFKSTFNFLNIYKGEKNSSEKLNKNSVKIDFFSKDEIKKIISNIEEEFLKS